MSEQNPAFDDPLRRTSAAEPAAAPRPDDGVRAQDDWGLVEVVLDSRGRVREVAINADLADRTNLADLAEAMLQAARAAQARADALALRR
ncbi:hypothetical protein B1813_20635 [Saccharomonospora piscinae]|uniref:YbaB/EbfC DNA-binding family protein n=1 Tax=Saccharomonospora piscinae TaxID=687388 RepID=A0A1V8ZX55_SACPI|nr:YbaB/EbfC family nucleoid-associated protein [Saccharomonospora piscinae]OQO89356.1 hypothetical protein B1813_20635 [Saccharomonospora piscinae]TLW91047.1 hypothetical protein FFT09_17385 [Saccharomonospora piscinae]